MIKEEMHKNSEEGQTVRNESGMAYIPVSQSSLRLTFSKGLGDVTELFYSFPPVLAHLRSTNNCFTCVFSSLSLYVHTHIQAHVPLFHLYHKIKPTDQKRLHFLANRSTIPSAAYVSSLLLPFLLVTGQELTLHLRQSSHIPHTFSRTSHYLLLLLFLVLSFYCTLPITI